MSVTFIIFKPDGSFTILLAQYNVPNDCLFGIGDFDGQLDCSVHNCFVILGRGIRSTVRLVAYHHLKLLYDVDQELEETAGKCVHCLVVPRGDSEHQDLSLESSTHSVVNASGLLPVLLNLFIVVGQVPDELL